MANNGMYFVGSTCNLYSASISVVMYAISAYIGPRYNGTGLSFFVEDWMEKY